VALYGGGLATLAKLQKFLLQAYPGLTIGCAISPPFRPLSEDERNAYTAKIRNSGARILFVGLGCPKQEKWMAENVTQLNLVMLGVGAAFDFYAGDKKVAPAWMRKAGLEWLHRFISEPHRLWKRYLMNNPHFVYLYLRAIIRRRFLSR